MLPGAAERAAQTIAAGNAAGLHITVTSVVRTVAEQTKLRDEYDACVAAGMEGQPGPCQYPANKAGDSAHQYGFAFDSVPGDKAQMDSWVAIRKAYGWRVPDNDTVHAEVPRWRDCLAYLRFKGLLR